MRMQKGGIAFFDSGIGGLTVLSECVTRLQDETFYYFGDNRHAPYGNLPERKIKKLVFRAFRKFARLKVKAVVLACNTATATCVEDLRKKYAFPIVGAEPAIFCAAKSGGEVFILATAATCASARFRALFLRAQKKYPTARLCVCPCPHLAGAIEKRIRRNGLDGEPLPLEKLLPKGSPSAVVLGCTHYIYIKKEIGEFYNAPVYDGNAGIAARLASLVAPQTEKNREGKPLVTPPKKQGQKPPIFFLGSQKRENERVFEQMFVNVRK